MRTNREVQSVAITTLSEGVHRMSYDLNRVLDGASPAIESAIQILDSKIQISMFWLLMLAIAGIIFGWLVAKLFHRKRITGLSNTLAIERERKSNLAQTVEALSHKALRQNNEAFFALANGRLPLAVWQGQAPRFWELDADDIAKKEGPMKARSGVGLTDAKIIVCHETRL
jgi:hypothetical protein